MLMFGEVNLLSSKIKVTFMSPIGKQFVTNNNNDELGGWLSGVA